VRRAARVYRTLLDPEAVRHELGWSMSIDKLADLVERAH
jgi:hypothetical protein